MNTQEQTRRDLEIAVSEAGDLEGELIYKATLLGKASESVNDAQTAVRYAKQDIEGWEATERSYQEAMRLNKQGVLTAGDAKGRDTQFDSHLNKLREDAGTEYGQKSRRLLQAEAKLRGAESEEDALKYQWSALRAVAELKVARINALRDLLVTFPQIEVAR